MRKPRVKIVTLKLCGVFRLKSSFFTEVKFIFAALYFFFFSNHLLFGQPTGIRLNLQKPGDKKDQTGMSLLVLGMAKLIPCTVSV